MRARLQLLAQFLVLDYWSDSSLCAAHSLYIFQWHVEFAATAIDRRSIPPPLPNGLLSRLFAAQGALAALVASHIDAAILSSA